MDDSFTHDGTFLCIPRAIEKNCKFTKKEWLNAKKLLQLKDRQTTDVSLNL